MTRLANIGRDYRREIDGLRGLAVALVVGYHAKIDLIRGGYVGVDVFFVISGFLIIGLLADAIELGTFDVSAFFARRLRRILPAAVVVAATTLVCGYLILGPTDYRMLGLATLSFTVFVSNIFFWRTVVYFADSTEQPLVHTWSLSVEEQFYVAVPFLIIAIWKLPRRWRVSCLAVGMAGSLLLCVILTGARPSAAFYLLPTRLWELLLGGLVAIVGRKPALAASLAEGVSALGLVAILASATLFGPATPYPGLAATLPCFGAAAIIWSSGARTTAVATVLRIPVLVGVGLISYSLYLWHWPVLTLARYYADRDLGVLESTVAIAAICVAAYLSWRYVEQPFRSGSTARPTSAVWLSVALTSVAVGACSIVVVLADGLPGRFSEVARAYDRTTRELPPDTSRCHHGPPDLVVINELCVFGSGTTQPTVLLWGDSHANALAPEMKSLSAEHGVRFVQASYSSCPPILGVDVAYTPIPHRCHEFNDMVRDAVPRLAIGTVVLAAYWAAYVDSSGESRFATLFDLYSGEDALGGPSSERNEAVLERALQATVKELESQGIQVWIVRQVPVHARSVPIAMARIAAHGGDPNAIGIALSDHRNRDAVVSRIFAALPATVGFLDPAVALCKGGLCRGAADGASLYIDKHHLSVHGAAYLRDVLAPVFP